MSGVFSEPFWKMRRRQARTALFISLTFMLGGCGDTADAFFSGRPSAMAVAHNGALDGSINAMRIIFEIPARLPQAKPEHHSAWQESPIAWWLAAGGRERIIAALAQLDRAQLIAAQHWLSTPEPYGDNKRHAIAELRHAAASALADKGARP